MLKSIRGLDVNLWKKIMNLYFGDPLTHVYLVYDLIYEIDNTNVCFNLRNGDVSGYILIWKGWRGYGIHVWGEAFNLISKIPVDKDSVIQIYDEHLLKPVIEYLDEAGKVLVNSYLNMVVDEDTFKPYEYGESVPVRLKVSDSKELFELLNCEDGDWRLEDLEEFLAKWRWYGIYVDGRLVSVSSAYVRMPEVWMISAVYTHPDYRGRGYGKIVTSAITRDAINSGAKARLHVKKDNQIAIKVYRHLGYRISGEQKWVFFKTH